MNINTQVRNKYLKIVLEYLYLQMYCQCFLLWLFIKLVSKYLMLEVFSNVYPLFNMP